MKKNLYIGKNVKVISEENELKTYELLKDEKKIIIKTKKPLEAIRQIYFQIDENEWNENEIEITDEQNSIVIDKWLTDDKSKEIRQKYQQIINYKKNISIFSPNEVSKNLSEEKIEELKNYINKEIENLKSWILEQNFLKPKRKPHTHNRGLRNLGYVLARIALHPIKIKVISENEDGTKKWEIKSKFKGMIRTIEVTTKYPLEKAKYIQFYIPKETENLLSEFAINDLENQISVGNID